ncbi:hypothetical protein [Mesorhizobium sp. CAU 1741]|uniref:hypothetical protein n=1 Tax=Mesorhizobium sp. CAU 1741 TaxID=3140366 RepID=UPI00325AB07D
MKVSMKITRDGLLRALRTRAHQIADEVEAGYRGGSVVDSERRERGSTGARDDVSSR